MKEKNLLEMPDINFRIKLIIDSEYDGNVRKFSKHIGLSDSSKINRLFNRDSRHNNFPTPSLDIIKMISLGTGYSTDYLINGSNIVSSTIDIDNRKNIIKGNDNIMNESGNVSVNSGNENYLDIINKQQSQIDALLKIISQQKS